MPALLRYGALGHQDQVMAFRQILQRFRNAGQKFDRMTGDGMGESVDGLVQGRGNGSTARRSKVWINECAKLCSP